MSLARAITAIWCNIVSTVKKYKKKRKKSHISISFCPFCCNYALSRSNFQKQFWWLPFPFSTATVPELKSLIISSLYFHCKDTCSQPQTLVQLENQLFALLAPRVQSWIRGKPTSENRAGFTYMSISMWVWLTVKMCSRKHQDQNGANMKLNILETMWNVNQEKGTHYS